MVIFLECILGAACIVAAWRYFLIHTENRNERLAARFAMAGYVAAGMAFGIFAVRRILYILNYRYASHTLYVSAAAIGIVGCLLLAIAVPFLIITKRQAV